MSRFPNCRVDNVYNEKYLKGKYADIISGYDNAVVELDCLFSNLEVYPDLQDILDPDKAVVNRNKVQILKDAVEDWLEMHRNEMITAFLDHQEVEEEDGE